METTISNFFNDVDFNSSDTCEVTKDDCVRCLSEGYWDDEVDYGCENKRLLYVVRYLPVHTKEVRAALDLIPTEEVEKLLNTANLNVVCLGGGPGTDNRAFNKWLNLKRTFKKGKLTDVRITRVDRCSEWNDISPRIIWDEFPGDIKASLKMNNHDVVKHQLKIGGKGQLLIASYLISEIALEDIDKLADNIRRISADGAHLVINDRNQTEVVEKIEALYEALGVESPIVCNAQSHCGVSYPDEIREQSRPKLNTSSIKFYGKI
ncbi:hypothetical protein [Photobacterium leiognathi]|uniref:hypothetical protein n=1 Tax=Photobacterium leiognathi TaxID=553611 RepID=UPI002981C394|nr:hypothetical protein [Photobacterium leiognathi]